MKKGKLTIALLLSVVMSLLCVAPAMAAPETKTVQASAAKVKTGWKTVGNKKYYVLASGKNKKGWLTVKGNTYYLSPTKNGVALEGLKTVNGNAYYFNKNGKLLRSRYCIKIKNRYYCVSGKGVLKQLSSVASLAGVRLAREGGTLKGAFKWSAGLKYYPNSTSVAAGSAAAKYYGSYGFKNLRGDCNVQAYTFYWMAKLLGYDVRYMKGFVPQAGGTMGAHAWCEIREGGKTYVYDPNFAAAYGVDRGFRFTYGTKGTYRYYDKNKKPVRA